VRSCYSLVLEGIYLFLGVSIAFLLLGGDDDSVILLCCLIVCLLFPGRVALGLGGPQDDVVGYLLYTLYVLLVSWRCMPKRVFVKGVNLSWYMAALYVI
jgi:hypothetical protein